MSLESIYAKCNSQLWGTIRPSPKHFFSLMESVTSESETHDFYGSGSGIEHFEKKMAQILGKEDAIFMPSGTMAQQIALRVWAETEKNNKVMFHPLSHLEIHENQAIYKLHPKLDVIKIGENSKLLTLDELKNKNITNGTLLLELPQRELGGILPSWEELLQLSDWCRNHQVRLHLDGARLWECTPYYQKNVADMAKLFDSVYVSFYKGLAGLAGAILAANRNFIQQAKKWQRRYGGNLISLYPYYLSADYAYEQRINKMKLYFQKAIEIASILNSFSNVTTSPKTPQTNMFHVKVKGNINETHHKLIQIALREKIRVIPPPKYVDEGNYIFEFTVGDESLRYNDLEIEKYFRKVFS